MRVSYYPGCSLEGMANDYARSIEAVFKDLGIELIEIDDWSCCGSTAAHSLNEMMSVVLPARNLAVAEKLGLDIVSPCAMCFNRLRFSQNMLRKGLFDVPWPVSGDLRVHDMTRYLADPEMLKKIRQRVVRPLSGLKLVCYYGCQMVRPPKITGYIDYENPQTLDRLAQAAGAEVIDWSYKATCCGASIGIARKDIQSALTERILLKAVQTGADAVVVSCPLCQSNLDMFQQRHPELDLPVLYFTELLRVAFASDTQARWFYKHFVDPVPLLASKGLIN